MSNYTELYWLTRLDYINGLTLAMAIIGLAYTPICLFSCALHSDFDSYYEDDSRKKNREKWTSKIKLFLTIGVIALLIRVLSPSKNEVIFIVAGGKTIDFIQKDTSLNKIPSQTTAIISSFLDKQIKELNSK